MSFDLPSPQQPMLPQAPPKPPMFGERPVGNKPKAKSQTPTFLGTGTAPTQGQLGQKTLLGQ